jgi:hypothetical protein
MAAPRRTPRLCLTRNRSLTLSARLSRVLSSRRRDPVATRLHVLSRAMALEAYLGTQGRGLLTMVRPMRCGPIHRLPVICRNGWRSIRTCL